MDELNKVINQITQIFKTISFEFPEILIYDILPFEIKAIYDFITKNTKSLVGNPMVYDRISQQEKPLSSVIDPALKVTTYELEPFHFLVRGIVINDVILPDLGIFILDKGVAIDYEPGSHWNNKNVTAFLEFLQKIIMLCANYKLKFSSFLDKKLDKEFENLFRNFIELSSFGYKYER